MSKSGADAGSIETLHLVNAVFYAASAVLFTVGLVGLFERLLQSTGRWVRWLADSSYWIYIVHLPVAALLTFYLAHLDRQGRLEQLTGFGWSAEMKFAAACAATAALGIVTYRYLVRYTPVGTLLNGKRSVAATTVQGASHTPEETLSRRGCSCNRDCRVLGLSLVEGPAGQLIGRDARCWPSTGCTGDSRSASRRSAGFGMNSYRS